MVIIDRWHYSTTAFRYKRQFRFQIKKNDVIIVENPFKIALKIKKAAQPFSSRTTFFSVFSYSA